ncbi:HD domain-containing protein [Alkalibaculum sp. M08DMB]|uniref:HD domain-containing protein n=1 Tax=Alkalibaculum sporogenes TaxID=2655001 RepID=A0A6A7KD37_9FIRM|nr:HD domain-containing protein [Alkalibaculum sporogenes]MPW27241.1 HD domain-containing protein [Alkalibaculum sporogenes]
MKNISELISNMIVYYAGDVKRINHFLKVYSFAKAIGENERLDNIKQETLEIAAVTHDIGIKVSELKYNSSSAKYQQLEGPAIAEEMLKQLGCERKVIKRVSFLIANHHTYNNIDDIDYQILVESDFLVNIEEDKLSIESIKKIQDNIFKSKTGNLYLEQLYLA